MIKLSFIKFNYLLLLFLFIVLTPTHVAGVNFYQTYPPGQFVEYRQEYQRRPRGYAFLSPSSGLAIAGGILAGAAAGAGAGYGAAHSGKKGDKSPFEKDEGETLTFNFTMNFQSGTANLISFVSTPDGQVREGEVFSVDGPVVGLTLTPITLEDPVFGTYTAGVQINASGETVTDLTISAMSSATGSTATIFQTPGEITIATETTQLSGQFTYIP